MEIGKVVEIGERLPEVTPRREDTQTPERTTTPAPERVKEPS